MFYVTTYLKKKKSVYLCLPMKSSVFITFKNKQTKTHKMRMAYAAGDFSYGFSTRPLSVV